MSPCKSREADEGLVSFEPDLKYIEQYQAYPCPGIMEVANSTVVRLLNASADQPLQIIAGTVLGKAKPVSRVADGFYLEVGAMADREVPQQVNQDIDSDYVNLEFQKGRVLSIVGVSEGCMTHATQSIESALPNIVVTPAEFIFEEGLSEAHRRYLMQDPDPFSERSLHLSDEEIREYLCWNNLEAPDAWKQTLFELCCSYRKIFASEGNDRLRTALIEAPFLICQNFALPSILYTDASCDRLGAVLEQIAEATSTLNR